MGGVDRFFFAGNTLPSMPEMARQLVASFDDDAVDLNAIVGLTGREPAMAAKVVRLANAPRYVRAGAVATLGEAAELLGSERLRNLVLAASIAGAFPDVPGIDRLRFWKHAIATAGYAQWLARILGVDPDSGYLSGFMLRSGQLLMAQVLPEAVAKAEADSKVPATRMAQEKRALGCSHAEVTAELARRWQLPLRLVDGFSHACEPLKARPFSMLAAVLHMAATMADAGDLGVSPTMALEEADNSLLLHLRLDVPWLRFTAPAYDEMTAPVEELLG